MNGSAGGDSARDPPCSRSAWPRSPPAWLAGQEAAIGRLLATPKAMLATARAEVRALVRAEQARQEAARRAMVAAAPPSARWASPTGGGDRAGLVRLLGAGPPRLRRRRAVAAADLRPAVDAVRPAGYTGATRPGPARS